MTDQHAAAITAAAHAINAGLPAGLTLDEGPARRAAERALEAAAPHITAAAATAERDRIISLASQLRAAIPADHPAGAQASFADYLRVTAAQDMREALSWPPLPADAP